MKPTTGVPESPRSLCLFTCGARPYAVGVESVVEVIELGPLVRIPLGPRPVLGLCVYRGGVAPIAWPGPGDMPAPEEKGPAPAVLVLRSDHGLWGLAIDRGGVAVGEAPPGWQPGTPSVSGFLSIVGEIDRGGKSHALLDPEASWQTLRTTIEHWYGEVSRSDGLDHARDEKG